MARVALIALALVLAGCGSETRTRTVTVQASPTPTVGPAQFPGLPVFCTDQEYECYQGASRVEAPTESARCGPRRAKRIWFVEQVTPLGPEGIEGFVGFIWNCWPFD